MIAVPKHLLKDNDPLHFTVTMKGAVMSFYDSHTHCLHSFDSTAEIDAMVRSAINAGLPGICFTDHHDIDFPKESPSDPDALLDIPEHIKSIRDTGQRFSDRIDVLCGIEIGLQPHLAKENSEVTGGYPFDLVIGSCHLLYGEDPYYGRIFEGRVSSDVYHDYFVNILENITAFHDFDVLGHLDYIVRYGPEKDKDFTYDKYCDIIDDILKKIITMGKGIEINTSGLKSGLKWPNPCFDIVKRYRELGGDIITTGSDAHEPAYVGYEFERLPEILKDAGFDHYNIFRNRKPVYIPI